MGQLELYYIITIYYCLYFCDPLTKVQTGSAVKERITLLNRTNYVLRVLQEKTHYSTKVCFKLYHSRKTTKNAASFVLAHLSG